MDRQPNPQLSLFPEKSPQWKSLSQDRQRELQEVLSQLLEQVLQWQTSATIDDSKNQITENHHV